MNRGCVWCKMRDAILGCMGGQPKSCEKLPKGGHSRRQGYPESSKADNSEQQFVFDDRGLGSEEVPKGRQSARGRQIQTRKASVERHRARCYQNQRKKQTGKSDQWTQTLGTVYTKAPTIRKKRKPPSRNQGQGHRDVGYDRGRRKVDCEFYYKQYQRDILKRQAERLPLLQYQYEDGRPIRGILKKPQFVRTPRMDELIVVEVCTL